ncbi:hypothetical protein D3C79_929080 [compost metagenome]
MTVGAGHRRQVVGVGRLAMLAVHALLLLLVAVGAGLVGVAQELHFMCLGQCGRGGGAVRGLALQAGEQHGCHQHQS